MTRRFTTSADFLAQVAAKQPEEAVQQGVLKLLRLHQHTALSTVHRVRLVHCPHCGKPFTPPANYGADRGVPDVIARASSMRKGVWLGLEVKGPKTPLSPEQQRLEKAGAIIVVRTPDAALKALQGVL